MSRHLQTAWPGLALFGLLAVGAFTWYCLTSARDFLAREFRGRLVCPPRTIISKPQGPQFPLLVTTNETWSLDFLAYSWRHSNSNMRQLLSNLNGRPVIVRGRRDVFRDAFAPSRPPRPIIRVVDIQPAPTGTLIPPAPSRPPRPVPRRPLEKPQQEQPTTAGS